MKFELVEPLDWEDPPQTARSEAPEPPQAVVGPVRAAADRARERLRLEREALQSALGRMWETITSVQAEESVILPADSVTPANFRPGAFSSRNA
ncbi:hypothetical protein [Nocardiopsis lambiniae]|uniref:Uncharacterized protein n=1 Tax=Nocardiopsis lambiniae TaxID=3075539 RepID=A0ABU2M2H2_9ACTN|nr:hypothetical protein [Nocardiopsis sp. DSM 44743]MDT0326822.1 hypothetical protein [Nocardiopsis sp. DSM 44743]